jgi:hypothetical protein
VILTTCTSKEILEEGVGSGTTVSGSGMGSVTGCSGTMCLGTVGFGLDYSGTESSGTVG